MKQESIDLIVQAEDKASAAVRRLADRLKDRRGKTANETLAEFVALIAAQSVCKDSTQKE